MSPGEIDRTDRDLKLLGQVSVSVVHLRRTHGQLHLLLDSKTRRSHLFMSGCTYFCGSIEALGYVSVSSTSDGVQIEVQPSGLLAIGSGLWFAEHTVGQPNRYAALRALQEVLTLAGSGGYAPEIMGYVQRILSALGDPSGDPTDNVLSLFEELAVRFPDYGRTLVTARAMEIRVL